MKRALTFHEKYFLLGLLQANLNGPMARTIPIWIGDNPDYIKQIEIPIDEQVELENMLRAGSGTYYQQLYHNFIDGGYDDILDMIAMVKSLATGIKHIISEIDPETDFIKNEEISDFSMLPDLTNDILKICDRLPRVNWGLINPDDEINLSTNIDD